MGTDKSKRKNKKSLKLWTEAKRIIPGGGQVLSKRPELFLPDLWPVYYSKAKGVEIWDLDGKKYIDMSSMGVGACILGYADPDVNRAVKEAVENGSMTTLNCPEEVELAKLLCSLHPWAKMARFARTGGEAMAIAVRIARAYSGKDKIAFCGYHGWSDWYLAANLADDKNLDGCLLPGLEPRGVPHALKGTAIPFNYGRADELEKILVQNKDVGVIVTEPLRHRHIDKEFLKKVKVLAKKAKAVLIFDEITIGWKITNGGAHLTCGVTPDIAVFGKAMSNGFPMAAIIGRKKVMQAAQKTFISSTYWTERIGPTAALATIRKIISKRVLNHLEEIGKMIWTGWEKSAKKHNLKIKITGPYSLVTFSFNYGKDSQAIRTLFVQEMLARGFLAMTSVYLSFAHQKNHIEKYLQAIDEVFGIISKAIAEHKIYKLLKGPIAQTGFKRLTD